MRFRHSPQVWSDFPELVCGVLHATGVTPTVDVGPRLARHADTARARLTAGPEGGFPEIQAWRRAFARLGLPPTRYRCAAESLLRRFRRDGALPRLHPLVDLGNALSLGYAVPVAVLDVDRIAGDLAVRPATGEETYLTLGGDDERPERNEMVFADSAGRAHSRRWTHRQSGWSAVRDDTTEVLVVIEALHDGAAETVPRMLAELSSALEDLWRAPARTAVLTADAPVFAVARATAG
ncbi:B3/B4 domain-containing protein [Micromonospora narathiwatensis]|uniref:B3/B4 domain-containing protein (DNA/RNA-binding domain of Phe-tRNA-synthetase) n=1 Tax=Micromonospora narathiwatensis TaxID=299146 RepID=A0A1A8ZLV5_9ACTN|nr:phenylalanine--tRNA ligase beta subunit-related protein [Micromonospora narathiwatensis]SBT45070.1 B3/B4 domain-containing protein (DNA/RNA-binding domain of Phe-tRNA-synthetase) [Micromonospora narathiwatensis]